MKKTLLILSIITFILAGCKKFDEIEASRVEIVEEKIEKGWDYIKINVEYDYLVALEAVSLYLSEKEDMSDANVYECNVEGKKYSVDVDSLKAGVAYYYCYEYDNGYEKEKGGKKSMQTISKLVVVTKDITSITTTSATLNGSLTNSDAANKIMEKGFCWGKEKEPTIEGNHISKGSSTGTYSYSLTNLTNNTTYYVRAYVKTNFGIVYGEEKSFTTVEIVLPTVTTNTVTNITTNSATCGGNVTFDGNATVTARGVCWSTKPNPTISDSKTTDGSGTGSYTSNLSNLASQTTYYVRAYATNEKGTSYGEEKSFTTRASTGTENGYGWVDLGLSVKWATCNVGASKPEEYGNYYAWGETSVKETYDEENCPTYGLTESELQSQGCIDIEGKLNPQYDAATANWGGNWRMPTKAEQEELLNNCTWTWTTHNGVNGYNVEGPNGNSIFFPAAGYRISSWFLYAGSDGYYWSSTSYDSKYYCLAFYLVFYSSDQNMDGYFRNFGKSVRPVLE